MPLDSFGRVVTILSDGSHTMVLGSLGELGWKRFAERRNLLGLSCLRVAERRVKNRAAHSGFIKLAEKALQLR